MTKEYSILCMDNILLIDSSMDGHLGGFCLLAVVNNAFVHVIQWSTYFVGAPVFSFLWHRYRSGIAGLYVHVMCKF